MAFLKVGTIHLGVILDELALASQISVGCRPILQGFFKLGQGIVLHGLILKLSDHFFLLLLVQLHSGVVLSLMARLSIKVVEVAQLAILIRHKRVRILLLVAIHTLLTHQFTF